MVPWSLQLDQYVRIKRGLLFCKFNLKGACQLLRLMTTRLVLRA